MELDYYMQSAHALGSVSKSFFLFRLAHEITCGSKRFYILKIDCCLYVLVIIMHVENPLEWTIYVTFSIILLSEYIIDSSILEFKMVKLCINFSKFFFFVCV